MPGKQIRDRDQIVENSLKAFLAAGSPEISLDRLAGAVGVSKRMLIHYFGGREELEEKAFTLLEDRLRAQFAPSRFPSGLSIQVLMDALWQQSTAPESRGVLLLVMDLTRRAWSGSPGSERARAFYNEQQRLWQELLLHYLPDQGAVEELLQLFQGTILAYLVTGDPEPGRRSLARLCARLSESHPTPGPN